MSNRDEGLFIPRRLVFIMIIVSLCVNVFFLLMGILIGKDDIKWNRADPTQPPVEVVEEDPAPRPSLEEELAVFEDEAPVTRRPPIDQAMLEPDTVTKPAVTQNQAPLQQSPPPHRTQAETTQAPSKPPAKKPTAKKPEPKPKQQERPKATSGFWIQVAASSSAGKAAELANKAKSLGYGATVVRQGNLHKVRVGPYRTRADANTYLKAVNRKLKLQGWVVED